MSWIVVYLTLFVGFCACIYLFVSTNVRQTALDRRTRKELKTVQDALAEMQQKLAMAEAELDERIAALAAPPEESMNLTKRAQALRMHRRGESPEAISTALGLTQTEVDLMLKVQKLVMDGV